MKMKAVLLSLLLLGSTGIAMAQTSSSGFPTTNVTGVKTVSNNQGNQGAWKQKFQNMTPEQREAKRTEWRQKFANMTPQEREAFKAKRRARFENLSPDQKQAMMARREQRHQERQGRQQTAQ